MKKIIFFIAYILFSTSSFANDLVFYLTQNITVKGPDWNEYEFKKGDIFLQSKGIGFGVTQSKPLVIHFSLYNSYIDKEFDIPVETLTLKDNLNKVTKNISKDYWIPYYYYLQTINAERTNIVLHNEQYWETFENTTEDQDATWIDFFRVNKFYFGDFYFIYFGGSWYDDVDFLAYLDEISQDKIVYTVQNMYSHFFDYKKRLYYVQPEYLPLFKRQTPFKVIFTIDGDYMKMYIDEVSDKTLFQTLVRTSPAAREQIENWIKSKSDDLSKVTWPRHADGTCDYETAVRLQSGKRYRASDNLRLRSSGSTAGKPVVTIGKGTQVKVLSIGTEQTIDGITSNWVQVEVQAGAKDRDGKPIDSGTTGWCFGGYLAE